VPRYAGVVSHSEKDFPIATVGVLIVNGHDELLMIRTHKWSHRWGIPGGKIKRGETCEVALRREVREETALEIGDIHWVMAQDCIEPPEFERSAHFLLLNYIARCTDAEPQVVLNDEAEDFRWVRAAEALSMELNQPTRVLIDEALRLGFIPADS
jgi:phosphoglycolate phosphatase